MDGLGDLPFPFKLAVAAIGCDTDSQGSASARNEPRPVNLVDSNYFRSFDPDSVEEGVRGFIAKDFDEDGRDENLFVHEATAIDENGEPMRDDGSDWYVYIREETGETTYVLVDYMIERLDVAVGSADSNGVCPITLLKSNGSEMESYRSDYLGPNTVRTVELMTGNVVPTESWRKGK